MSLENPADGYYQLSLVWPKDRAKQARYDEAMRGVIATHGGSYERIFVVERVIAEGVAQPEAVYLARFPTRQAFIAYQHDEWLREARLLFARDLPSVSVLEGCSIYHSPPRWDLVERQYLIEIVRLGLGGLAVYQQYEQNVAPVMTRHGHSVERVLQTEYSSGLPFRANLVKIACFDKANGFARLQADAEFASSGRSMYRSVTRNSIWIVGRLAEVQVQPSRSFG